MASNEITHRIQLDKLLEDLTTTLLEMVAKDVLLDFQNKYIFKYVYKPNTPVAYQRTWDFLKFWKFSDVKKLAKHFETTMSLDWESMTVGTKDNYIHSAYSPLGEDTREALAGYLNKDGRSSGHWMSRKNGQAYWDIFLKEYVDGGKLDRVVQKHAKSLGLSARK